MTRMTRWSPFWDWNMTPVLRSEPASRSSADAYLPPIDIEEEEGRYVVTLSVPGYRQDQLEISLEVDVLQIQGALKSENEGAEAVSGRKFHLRERHMNRFSSSLRLLAGIEGNKVGAKYDKGVLTLTIPKPEEVLPKQIEVEMA